jgi:hypothetical protein
LADELFSHVLARGNLLLENVVDEGLSPVNMKHHDLLTGLWWRRVSGHGHRLRDGWPVKFVDKDSNGFLCGSGTKLRQDIRCNVVDADDVMELKTVELVLELADFKALGIHVLRVVIPRFINDHCRVALD